MAFVEVSVPAASLLYRVSSTSLLQLILKDIRLKNYLYTSISPNLAPRAYSILKSYLKENKLNLVSMQVTNTDKCMALGFTKHLCPYAQLKKKVKYLFCNNTQKTHSFKYKYIARFHKGNSPHKTSM